MSRRITWADAACPIARAADILGEPWTLLILRNATAGTTRFEDFRAQLGIADNVLTTRLAKLVDRGLLTKLPYRDGGRTRHEYRLTAKGLELYPVIVSLMSWGDRWMDDGDGPPLRLTHLDCDGPLSPPLACGTCGAPVTARDVRATPA